MTDVKTDINQTGDDRFKWTKRGEVYVMCSSMDPKTASATCVWTMFRQDGGGVMVQLNGVHFGRDRRGLLPAMQARVNRVAAMMGHQSVARDDIARVAS